MRVRRARLSAGELQILGARLCTTPARTLVDLAEELGEEAMVIALESAWRQDGLLLDQLRDDLLGSGHPGSARLRRVLEDAELRPAPLRSALEVRAWRLLRAERLPRPKPGYVVVDDEGWMELDFAYPERRLAIETDGRRFHSGEDAFVHDARRRSRLAVLGWIHVTLTHHELTEGRDALIARLIRLFEENPPRRRAARFEDATHERFNEPAR